MVLLSFPVAFLPFSLQPLTREVLEPVRQQVVVVVVGMGPVRPAEGMVWVVIPWLG